MPHPLVRAPLHTPVCETSPASWSALGHDEQLTLFMHLLMRSLQLLRPQVRLHKQMRDNQVIVITLPSDTINIRGWDPIEFVWWVWFRQLLQRSWPACWQDLPMKSGVASVLIDCSYGWTNGSSYDEKVRQQLLEICQPYLITGENAS